QSDIDAGLDIVNVASVSSEEEATDSATETVDVNGAALVDITKVADVAQVTEAGQVITYTYTVTNTGVVTLTGLAVNDDKLGAITLAATTLAPGASTSGTATYTVLQSDIDAGLDIVNVASVSSEEEATDSATETVAVNGAASIDLQKDGTYEDTNSDGAASAGDRITYVFTVENTGNVTLTNISVSDVNPLVTVTGGPIVSLAPGQSDSSITGEYTLTQADIDGGSFTNTATATGEDPNEDPVSDDDDDEQTFGQRPSLDIEKDADQPSYDEAGDVLTYTLVVSNNGNVTLEDIVVTDPQAAITSGSPIASLAPGASATITASYTVSQADVDAGSFTNVATATTSYKEQPLTASDNATVNATQRPNIEFQKVGDYEDTNNDGVVNVGDKITYVFTVLNTGNVTLTNVTVTDSNPAVSVTGGPITLVPGQLDNTTFTGEYLLTQSDIDAGNFTNVATATAEDPDGEPVSDEDDDTRSIEAAGEIEMQKLGTYVDFNNDGVDNAGDKITYVFTVLNTGNVTLTNVTVTDANPAVTVTGGPIATLAPGELDITTFKGEYVLTQADIDAGTFDNTATATGTPPTGENVTDVDVDSQSFSGNPGLEISKVVTSNDDVFGGEVTYEIEVTNTGNVTLYDIYVEDEQAGLMEIIGELAPGMSELFTATVAITQEMIDSKCFTNTAVAEIREYSENEPGNGNEEGSYSVLLSSRDQVDVCFTQDPAIELLKDGVFNDENQDGFGNVGETISYSFTVTNTGNVTLSNIRVTDPMVTVVGGPISLAPGLSDNTTFTATYVITQQDIDNGYVVNTALAQGTAPNEEVVEDESSDPTPVEEPSTECETCTETELPQNPDIQIAKTDNGATVDGAGDVITYTLTVTNTGNVTLTNVTVSDPLTGLDVNLGTLTSGASTAVNTDYVVTQEDVDKGFVLNTALAEGDSPDEEDPTDETEEETPIERNPSIQIVKTDNDALVDGAGDVITYTLTVTNTGNVTLTNVMVKDPLTGLDQNVGTLNPGASTAVNTDYVVTQADVDKGFVLNTALVEGDSPDEEDPTDETEEETPIERNPSIQIVKTDNDALVDGAGDVITYTLTVTNTGNVTLTNVMVKDPLTGLDQNVGTLNPGASTAVNTDYVVTQADVDKGFVLNTALVEGDSPDEEDPTDETEEETPIERNPSIQIVKTDNGALVDGAGDVITYTLTVTNTGNVALTNVTVKDPLTGLDQNVGTLNPGASTAVNTDYVVTQEDVDKGFVLNTALAEGDSPDEEDPTDETEEETPIERNPSIQVVKTDNGALVDGAGDVITYTLTVTNTGNVTLTNVMVKDPLTGLDVNLGTLNPGAS
ncbi:hypothetical protein B0E43_22090, partial [Algoriphagus sp. A40]